MKAKIVAISSLMFVLIFTAGCGLIPEVVIPPRRPARRSGRSIQIIPMPFHLPNS